MMERGAERERKLIWCLRSDRFRSLRDVSSAVFDQRLHSASLRRTTRPPPSFSNKTDEFFFSAPNNKKPTEHSRL